MKSREERDVEEEVAGASATAVCCVMGLHHSYCQRVKRTESDKIEFGLESTRVGEK